MMFIFSFYKIFFFFLPLMTVFTPSDRNGISLRRGLR